MNLSDEAKSALINASSSEPGGLMWLILDEPVHAELLRAKMVTPAGYLLTRGSIERERLLAAAEDKAFGA
jgi:hypothetical protein